MLKTTTLFGLGYAVLLCVVYLLAQGDKFTPSSFGKWGFIMTPVYIVLFIGTLYFLKKKKANENAKH